MKKQIISWGMMLAAAFTLTNCAKEIEGPAQEPETNGYPFEIVASTVDTKTVNDGMATKWVDGDKINLFHAEAGGTEYQNDADFTVADVDAGRFTGELSSALEAGKKYDWYAIYPYSSQIETPGERTKGYTFIGHSNGLNQNGYNSTDALDGSNCPFYGVAKSVAANSIPSIDMKHLTSVVAINVTNTTDTPVTITTASLTATEDIVGQYYIDITGASVAYNPREGNVKNTATVNVSGGTALEKNQSAILYLAIKPFTAAEGTNLVLAVNGLEKTLELPNDVEFSAGKIKTLNFKYDAENVEVPAISVADFMELEDGAKVYELTGVITGIYQAYNSQYGNISFYITDDTGTVLIFRMTCDDILANAITVGDEITVQGRPTEYNDVIQMAQGGVCVSHRDGCATPVISCSENMVTITSEDGAKVYYTTDGTDPTTSSTPYTAPFAITETSTVKAIAVADGKLTSLVAEKECVWVDLDAEQPATVIATLKFTDTSTRTAHTTDKQVWEENGLMLVGEKAGSSSNVGDYSNPARFYKSSTITIKAPGNITKLVFESAADESSDSKKYLSFLETAVGDHTVDGNFVTVILDGTSNAVTYTMPGQVRLFNLEVTYIAGDGGEEPEQLQPRNLAFSPATATATVGQSFTEPTLSGVTTGVEYTSSNESVATVNAETGAVTLVGAGTTTIKASAPATAEYEAGEASYTLTVSAAVADDTDVLNRAATGVTSTSYADWTYESETTSAKYAGNSAGGNDAIQLRSNNSNSGVVTTTSGGYVKKIVVTWHSGTVDGRTLNVYGKNTAYSAATDLYNSNNQGTLLGTIVKGTSTSLEIAGNYQFIGLRSADGAMYLSEIRVTWSSEASDVPVVPELAVNPATVEVAAAGGNAEFGYTIINPADGVSVSASTEANWISGFSYSIANKVTFTVAENTATEAREAVITLAYEGTASKTITVKQDAAESNPGTGGGDELAESVTIKIAEYASANNWSNSVKYDTITLNDVITATATGGGNTGKYYTSGENWRFYQNESPTLNISASNGYTIKSVKITYLVNNSGVLTYNSSKVNSGTVVDVNASSITFGVGNTGSATNGQVRVTAIEVVYHQAN